MEDFPVTHAERPKSIWMFVLLTGLSVSIGWGIRGQFGHEYGAALAGALGGMVVALLSGREDWRRRVPFFAVLGAIGFGFRRKHVLYEGHLVRALVRSRHRALRLWLYIPARFYMGGSCRSGNCVACLFGSRRTN